MDPITVSCPGTVNRHLATNIIEKDNISFDDEVVFSFASIKPVFPGHTLISPVRIVTFFKDLTVEEILHMVCCQYAVVPALKTIYKSKSYEIGIQNGESAGMSVPHMHLHIIPYPSDGGFLNVESVTGGREGGGGAIYVSPDISRCILNKVQLNEYAKEVSSHISLKKYDLHIKQHLIKTFEDLEKHNSTILGGLKCDIMLSTNSLNVCLFPIKIFPKECSNLHLVIIPKMHYTNNDEVPIDICSAVYILAKAICLVLHQKEYGVNILPIVDAVGMKESHWALHIVQRTREDYKDTDMFYSAINGRKPFSENGYGFNSLDKKNIEHISHEINEKLSEIMESIIE